MKINDKLCDNCFGISKKRYNWEGKELCAQCWNENIKQARDAIAEEKCKLARLVNGLQNATGRQIMFGLDEDTDINVQRGLDIIAGALGKKPYDEKNYVGAPTKSINADGVRYYYTDWGKIENVN